MENFRMLCIWVSLTFYMSISNSLDTITPSQFIRDGDNTLVSGSGTFELGFFSPGNSSTRRYLGVWYKNISPPKVVWVANRPVSKISGVLQISENGVLLLLNAANTTVWSSNVSSKAENPIAQLLDSGNLIVRNENDHNSENYLWQSFDYPCDTLLPGMKLGLNLVTGLNRYISSWKTEDDPAQGEYTEKIDPRGYPQVVFMTGSVIKTRVGSWNGLSFTGYPILPKTYRYEFVLNEKEVYFVYELLDSSVFSMVKMSPFGIGQRFLWSSRTRSWQTSTIGQADQCENYGLCGANSICDMNGNSANCACLKGFAPKVPEEWDMSFWSNGCVRNIGLDCNEEQDGFWKYRNMKLPDTSSSWFSKTVKPEECRKSCLQNCSCAAYASLDIRSGGSGCLQWFGNLIDMRRIPHEGQDLFIRLHASELVAYNGHGNIRKKVIGISVGSTIVIMGIIIFGLTTYVRKKKLKFLVAGIFYSKRTKTKEAMDLPTYDLSIIAKATDNFSSNNKLGEGGFGPVYKGILLDRQEVAVKRLARKSGQGFEEFKNEVVLIAKLQHRNLVKLLSCCIEGEEKILIYEYMANKSLDFFIFDEDRSKLLDWPTRLSIISGIARGLLYLHQDSTLRIIHRDLKTSNILLDANLNPKISDFGLARTFLGEQVEANTNKVAGTYGYMPPEYAMRGHFSMKSDVFSFGVIVLEIISGKKNREFSDSEQYLNLLGHAWRLWTEGRALDLVDKMLGVRFIPCEVIRCIHVGLLCVQQIPEERPSMSNVILMLNGEKTLPKPKVPGFYTQRDNILEADHSLSARCQLFSPNEMSLTKFEAR